MFTSPPTSRKAGQALLSEERGRYIASQTLYYFGAYEKDIDKFGNIAQTDYIYTPAGLTALVKGGLLYYVHLDNLGCVQAITDESIVLRATLKDDTTNESEQ